MENDQESDTPQRESDTKRKFRDRKTTTKEKKAYMIEILISQLGIVMVACRQVGISRETHYKWIKKDKKYAQAVEDVKYNTKDAGEHYLLKLMKEGNASATIFFNKTQNKDRGYYEKQELNHVGDSPVTINLITRSNEEIKAAKGIVLKKG